jgi:hypothetical protein
MRSTSVAVLALAAIAAAAPVPANVDARAGAAGFSKILGNVANGAGLLSGGINIGNFLGGLLGGDEAAAKRSLAQVEDHLAHELMARDFSELEARAGAAGFSKILGNVANGAGLLSGGINIGNFLGGLFGGDDAAARREIIELGARELDARAGLASIGKVGNNLLNAGSLAFSLGNIGDAISGLFSRDPEVSARALADIEDLVSRDLMAREIPEIEARQGAAGFSKILGNVASGAGLLSSGINIGNFLGGLFGGGDNAARDLDVRAGLASVGKVGNNLLNAGSLAFSLGNIGDAISGLFSRDEEVVRSSFATIEDMVARDLMAREVPELAARQGAAGFSKILGNVASGAGLLSSGINIGNFLGGLFGGGDNAARDLAVVNAHLDARAGLASVGKVGNNLLNAGSLAFSLGNIGDAISGLFSREPEAAEIDARAGLASIGKVGNNLLNAGSLAFSLGNIGDAISGLFSRELDGSVIARELLEQELYRRTVADLD